MSALEHITPKKTVVDSQPAITGNADAVTTPTKPAPSRHATMRLCWLAPPPTLSAVGGNQLTNRRKGVQILYDYARVKKSLPPFKDQTRHFAKGIRRMNGGVG